MNRKAQTVRSPTFCGYPVLLHKLIEPKLSEPRPLGSGTSGRCDIAYLGVPLPNGHGSDNFY